MHKKRKPDSALTHASFIVLFLVAPTLAFVRLPGEPFFALTRVFVQDTVANFVMLCFFYLNYFILIPRFFFKHNYVRYIACVILFLSLALTLPYLAGRFLTGIEAPPPPMDRQGPRGEFFQPHHPPNIVSFVFDEFRRHLFLFFTAIFFSFLLRTRQHLSDLKEERLKAELASLKSQINPHFLFNTLNSIYGLSMKKDDGAPAAIINLSGLMRYVIKDANDYKIPLSRELEYIGNYMELQKARVGNTTRVEYQCTGDPGNKEIAPLILITYIENAFKYGVNPDQEDCIVEVKISVTETGLRMSAHNKKVPVAKTFESTGIGISNTGQRLQLLYPGKHSIGINEDDQTYFIQLTLELV
jgi:hypothetical protein